MRFRVIDQRGVYMARSPEIQRLELGSDTATNRAFSIHAPVCELLPEGTIVEGAHILPSPALEPLDPEAEEAMQAYLRSGPHSLDPTSTLPLSGGMDNLVQRQLDRLLREAEAPRPDELTAMRAREAARDAQIAELTEQVRALTARAAPAPSRKTPS